MNSVYGDFDQFDSEASTSNTRRKTKNSASFFQRHKLYRPNQVNEQYYLGDVLIGTSVNVFPDTWNTCSVRFILTLDTNSLEIKFDNDLTSLINIRNDVAFIKAIITSKVFAVQFQIIDGDVMGKLYISTLPLNPAKKISTDAIKMVFNRMFNITSYSDANVQKKLVMAKDVNKIYDDLKLFQENLPLSSRPVEHPFLKPNLRPYQKDAVRWMLNRENQTQNLEILHPLFMEVSLKNKLIIYYNKFTGDIELKKPLVSGLATGGILADEMGLGKTVEVLACILCNPKPFSGPTSSDILQHNSQSSEDSLTSPTVSTQVKSVKRPSIDTEFSPYADKSKKIKLTVDDAESKSEDSLTSPTVSTQSKSLKRPSMDPEFSPYVDKPKKIKLTVDDAKYFKNKSAKRIACEMWYNSILTSVNEPKKPSYEVRCICGDQNMEGTVTCVICSQVQHANCMGYDESLGEYFCPECWMKHPLLESNATLIISPLALRAQWCKEICKHVSSDLKVFVYEGSRANPIYPTKLHQYDLVLTTYNILKLDLRLTEAGERKPLRKTSRYCCPGSPIARFKWWRLCLDEAQTVEVSSSMIAIMANRIEAHHRWAVTGTPISQDISDLYGLISYLHLKPYDDPDTWNYLLYYPYTTGNTVPMFKFLSQVLWRSSKKQVFDQINIPPPTFHENTLEFSAIEKYYYQCEHESCSAEFLNKLRSYDPDILLSSLHKSNFKSLIAPLLTIRQACTHPGTTKGRYLVTRKPVTNMKDLLEALIEKNKSESEEKLRLIVSSINGLAGIYLLLNEPVMAVEEYRKVLQLTARFNREGVKMTLAVDTLQHIHTLYNLAEVMETSPAVDPTLRDHTLREDCRKLEEKYMEKYISQNVIAYQESQNASASVLKLQEKFDRDPNDWYTALIEWIIENGFMSELDIRIDNLLETCSNSRLKFANERRLLYLLVTWHDYINQLREETHKLLQKMYTYISSDDQEKVLISDTIVQAAVDCHLRPQKGTKRKKECIVCQISIKMREYETKLFDMTKGVKSQESVDISNTGSWKASSEELILTAIYRLGKSKNFKDDIINDGKKSFAVIKAIKNEFKLMRKFWTHLDQQVCAQDEIIMCKIRLSLKEPENEKKQLSKTESILKNLSTVLENKLEYINFISMHELDYQVSVLKNEETLNMAAMEKNLGTHNYLETLRNQQYAGQSPDPCPICKNVLQEHWSILPCGHCYCLDCIHQLLHNPNLLNISCSVCRTSHKIDDVSYIRIGDDATLESNLKGIYSTKIEAILKLVVKLENEDENVKILIFSTWDAILKTLKDAFTANNVKNVLTRSHNFQKSLDAFKAEDENVTVLLLPVHLGAKGLNLVEASHVIFVEPLINPADELQAIGRVHRIGQTKPVHVHKFIIKNSIEENIHHAISANADSWDKNKLTIQQLRNLFGESMDVQVISSEI